MSYLNSLTLRLSVSIWSSACFSTTVIERYCFWIYIYIYSIFEPKLLQMQFRKSQIQQQYLLVFLASANLNNYDNETYPHFLQRLYVLEPKFCFIFLMHFRHNFSRDFSFKALHKRQCRQLQNTNSVHNPLYNCEL